MRLKISGKCQGSGYLHVLQTIRFETVIQDESINYAILVEAHGIDNQEIGTSASDNYS